MTLSRAEVGFLQRNPLVIPFSLNGLAGEDDPLSPVKKAPFFGTAVLLVLIFHA